MFIDIMANMSILQLKGNTYDYSTLSDKRSILIDINVPVSTI